MANKEIRSSSARLQGKNPEMNEQREQKRACSHSAESRLNSTEGQYLACPIRNVIDKFGDKWSLLLLYFLHREGTMRFNELHHNMTDCSQKMLSQTLKRLEQINLLNRRSTLSLATEGTQEGLSRSAAPCRVLADGHGKIAHAHR